MLPPSRFPLSVLCIALAAIGIACGTPPAASLSPISSPSPSLTATNVPGCTDCVVRFDPVLTVSFAAPRALLYAPARAIQPTDLLLTDTARLSSYALDAGPRDANDLLVELFLAPRRGEDLAKIAATRFAATGTSQRSATVSGREALRLEGDFQSGRRVYVLVALDAERVLVLSALPRDSGRIADFERVLTTLAVT